MDLTKEGLRIERIANCDVFRGRGIPTPWGRLYGGQTIGQSLMAACMTVPDDKPVHSLHSYFILAGDSEKEILFMVDRIRDGGSFCTRAIKAMQDNRTICHTQCSFHRQEEGYKYSLPLVDLLESKGLGNLPNPESFLHKPSRDASHQVKRYLVAEGVDWTIHYVKLDSPDTPIKGWKLNTALLAYLSDAGMVGTAKRPHDAQDGVKGWGMLVSLDHAIHFHFPEKIRVDQWMILYHNTKVSGGARGLSTAYCYNLSGELLATYNQEALIRPMANASQL